MVKRITANRVRSFLLRRAQYLVNPPVLDVEKLIVGKNVIIEPGVDIRCKRLVLGDGVVIRSGTRIEMTDLVIGDYTKINNNCLLTGTDWCRIGHNCWFGHFTVIDSIGTTRIGNGVGVGAHSQLWTHIYFGDVLEGCRFASHKPLIIEDDVWFVGHCIVSPITAKKRTMATVGAVITKDMSEENHVYSGVPARDMTDRFGMQFGEVTLDEKRKRLENYLKEFISLHKPRKNRIKIVERIDPSQRQYSQFSLSERLYIKNLYPEEVKFMRFLTPTKAKFTPIPSNDWIRKYLLDY
jgi:acetyltransferase-like isoleucine patch superfamily enzyme